MAQSVKFILCVYHVAMTADELQQTFVTNLKRARTKAGLSQMKLAELADFSVGYIGDLESGRRWCTLDSLARIADVLHVYPHELLAPPPKELEHEFRSVQQKYFSLLEKLLHENLAAGVQSAISSTLSALTTE